MIGETVKDFRITGRLGKGGMGEVWVAEQQIVKTRVAIKVLLAELSKDQQLVQRFFNEAIAVSRIKHAGIVKIHDVGFHNGSAFLIMELLEGETLASRIRGAGRLPLGQVGEIGRQIASILEATHAAHITHRDLKPDNIFLVQDAELASRERAKILDFGIAKLGTAVGLTGSGGTMGTPGYMAPEQWTDASKADARADVYAVGCIAFQMCCGRRPFEVSTIAEAYAKHVFEVPPRASTLAPEVPRELDDVIARALAKQPPDRPSMAEFYRVFATMVGGRPAVLAPAQPASGNLATATHAEPDTTLRGAASSGPVVPRPRWWRYVAVGAIVGAIVLAGLGVAASRLQKPGTDPPRRPDAGVPPVDAPRAALANTWVRVPVPATPVVLGVDSDAAPAAVRGFRPARKITSPVAPYELQEHEVTWSEIEPWLARSGTSLAFPTWAADPAARAALPVTGVTWSTAFAYCQSLGGSLPTEAQWEFAARGAERRPNSWGADRLDRSLTHVYAGPKATPAAVKTSLQDQTPAPVLYDLIGNVQEWTLGLWREDVPDADESWVTSGKETTIRAIRGLPFGVEPPPSMQPEGAAYREHLCASGPCVEKGAEQRRYVGFRCAKPAAR
jgi:serine/threonine-protein kinase